MKIKFLLTFFFLGCEVSLMAQSFSFIKNNNRIKENDTVYCGGMKSDFDIIPVTIRNTTQQVITANLTVRVFPGSYGGEIGYCGWGLNSCSVVNIGDSLTSSKVVSPDTDINPDIETLTSGKKSFRFKLEYKLTYNNKEQKIFVVATSDVITANNKGSEFSSVRVIISGIAGNALLKYSFPSEATRQIQIFTLTGIKTTDMELPGKAGTVSLPIQQQGIYFYRITENNKTLKTGKFAVN